MNKTRFFLNEIDRISKIPEYLYDRAKLSLLDYLAVTFAGSKFHKERFINCSKFFGIEKGNSTIIGLQKNASLKDSVFFNGLNSHALDYDDGTNAGIIHLGSPIYSLLLPLGETKDVRVRDVLHSSIIGYEVSYTLAISMQPFLKKRGFHATAVCGTVGSTIAASYMLKYTQKERKDSFSAACVSASGMLKAIDDTSELKPYNVAKSSLLALCSMQMAKAGFCGNVDPLGGERGLLAMMTGKNDTPILKCAQDEIYAIQRTYIKPYASCRYTHPAIDAAISIRKDVIKDLEKINSVIIETYSLAVFGHDHTTISSPYSAKMSIPYSVAVGLLYGRAGLNEFDQQLIIRDEVIDLTKKIKVVENKEYDELFPKKQVALVKVFTKNKEYIKRVDYPKGEPENPYNPNEFRERFCGLMSYAGADMGVSKSIYERVMNLDTPIRDVLGRV